MSEPYHDNTHACPVCEGPGVLLGILGRLEHYRCRNCGMPFEVREVQGGFVAPGVREHMTEVTWQE
jgi:tRNA(Ile2) C34 agmatinyltransferase TiaS